MELYHWYLVLSVFLIVSEIFAPGFILLPLGLAGLVTATIAYFRPELWIHAVFFICGSGLALLAIARFRDSESEQKVDAEGGQGIIGQTGTVVSTATAEAAMRVKIFGDTWDVVEGSIPSEKVGMFPPGTHVRVIAVTGNKIAIERA